MGSNFPAFTDDAPLALAAPAGTAAYPYLVVRIYAAVYQRERIVVRAARWPMAQIGHQRSFVQRPAPFNADGTLSAPCRALLIASVQHAVRQTKFRMCIVWGPSSCTFVEVDSVIESNESPSGGLALTWFNFGQALANGD